MKSFVQLASFFVMVSSIAARPDAGYPSSSYASPSSSYGAPSGHGSNSGFGGHGGTSSFGSSGLGSLAGLGLGGGDSYSSAISGGYSNGGHVGSTVQKHIYVHVPPPEDHHQTQQYIPPPPPPQKHYKIVFIKAPTPPTPTAPVLPPVVQDSEKTLIYVLVKRPEDAPQIQIPTAAPTTPSKPEVYFIRYRTQKGQNGGSFVNGGSGLGLGGLGGLNGGGLDDPSGSSLSGLGGNGFSGHGSSGHGSPGHGNGVSSSYGAPSASGGY